MSWPSTTPFGRLLRFSSAPTTSSGPQKLRSSSIAFRHPPSRTIHASAPTFKKRNISASSPASSARPSAQDPLDTSALTSAFVPLDTHFRTQVQTILHGGRFDASSLGALPIPVKDETFPLRELAQVVPRSGRSISLLVNERAYIKPIMSAVQKSREFNQQPQRAEENDLELLMRVEVDRKEDLVRRVREVVQGWRQQVRQVRTKHDKVLKGWVKDGTVLKDVFVRAEREVQKVQDAKMREIDEHEKGALKELER